MSPDHQAIPTQEALNAVYGPNPKDVAEATARFNALSELFEERTGREPTAFFTAAGRTEIGGNHTDHQHGNVLAASVDLDTIACAALAETDRVRVMSTRYPDNLIQVGEWAKREEEEGSSDAMVRGLCAGLSRLGHRVGGVDIATDSRVPGGSGLSSSAAFEVLLGNVLNTLFCGGQLDAIQIAQLGQYAENEYFGKPSGLLDQMSCSFGGAVGVDFGNPQHPEVQQIDLDLAAAGYAMCIIDSGADHADLTADYAAIAGEMKEVALALGKNHLREVDPELFWSQLPQVREQVSDRAVRRAVHFFDEDLRVSQQIRALKEHRFEDFLQLVRDSEAVSECVRGPGPIEGA